MLTLTLLFYVLVTMKTVIKNIKCCSIINKNIVKMYKIEQGNIQDNYILSIIDHSLQTAQIILYVFRLL